MLFNYFDLLFNRGNLLLQEMQTVVVHVDMHVLNKCTSDCIMIRV